MQQPGRSEKDAGSDTKPALAVRLRVYAYELVKTFGLFSVLPVISLSEALRDPARKDWYDHAINVTQYVALPIVGVVKLGLALALGYGAAALWGAGPGAAIALIAYLALSGGMHLDGLADTFDALFCAGVKDPRVAIRDPHVGALGVVYLLFYLALYGVFGWLVLRAWLQGPTPALTAALLTVAVSPRILCHALVAVGFGAGFERDRLTRVDPPYSWVRVGEPRWAAPLWWAMLLTAVALVGGGDPRVLAVLIVGVGASLVLAEGVLRRRILPTLGFINGDVLGFTICLAELLQFLIVALVFVRV